MILRIFKWVGGILGVLLLLVIIAILVLSQLRGVVYKDFLGVAKKDIGIPGLNLNQCPQGVAYAEKENKYLFVGYMTDKTASKLYVKDENEEIMINLKHSDGAPYLGHVGGIATTGNHVFITADTGVYHCLLSDILALQNGDDFVLSQYFEVDGRVDYAFANEEYLFLGEFYRSKGYATQDSHVIKVSDKQTNHALVFAFAINEEKSMGFDETPSHIYSVTDEVQGFALTKSGKLILSCSYSIFSSRLHIYDPVGEADGTFTYKEKEVPIYYLNDERLEKKYSLMPMSEDLDYKNGKLYINFESACKKYKYFNIYQTKNVYTLDIE